MGQGGGAKAKKLKRRLETQPKNQEKSKEEIGGKGQPGHENVKRLIKREGKFQKEYSSRKNANQSEIQIGRKKAVRLVLQGVQLIGKKRKSSGGCRKQ